MSRFDEESAAEPTETKFDTDGAIIDESGLLEPVVEKKPKKKRRKKEKTLPEPEVHHDSEDEAELGEWCKM